MQTLMRPLLHSGFSGSTAAHSAADRSARRLFPAPSSCTSPSNCPQSAQLLNPHVELGRPTASASNSLATSSDASTTAVLTSPALGRSFNDAITTTCSQEAYISEHFTRPPALESNEPQPIASTSAPSTDPVTHPQPKRRRGGTAPAAAAATASSAPGAISHHFSPDVSLILSPAAAATPAAVTEAAPRRPDARTARLRPDKVLPPRSRGPGPSPSAIRKPSPTPGPLRPRLRPPPPPLSWPDYPYTRQPCASACHPNDMAALKLEALFQCVLHYPRVPPKLLRFLNKEVPEGVEARLAAVTATVECLAEAVGREVAVYLIRRSSWVVLVPAEAMAPRMEAVRRLLGLQPSGVPELLRKNPNLLRMQQETLAGRYRALQQALYDAVDFDEVKLRALVVKYPLILNFKHESVHSALMALRRLCSARPDWTGYYRLLSPSQVAFFMRERVVTLLRLEYLLLTGSSAGGWTLRDIMKMSNNMFHKAYKGFRSWMQDRLTRLRQRMARARRAVVAQAAAEGQPLSHEELVEVAARVQEQYARAEQERFHRTFLARREAERRDYETRMAQRQRAIEEKVRKQELEEAARRRQEARGGGEGPGNGDSEEEDDEEAAERRWRQRQQQQQRPGSEVAVPPSCRPPAAGGVRSDGGGFDAAAAATAGGARPDVRPQLSPGGDFFGGGDHLAGVSLGRIWQRPGSKVPYGPASPGSSRSRQQ